MQQAATTMGVGDGASSSNSSPSSCSSRAVGSSRRVAGPWLCRALFHYVLEFKREAAAAAPAPAPPAPPAAASGGSDKVTSSGTSSSEATTFEAARKQGVLEEKQVAALCGDGVSSETSTATAPAAFTKNANEEEALSRDDTRRRQPKVSTPKVVVMVALHEGLGEL
jgi:hypothetical protein